MRNLAHKVLAASLKIAAAVGLAALLLVLANGAPVAQAQDNSWSLAVCEGDEGVVWREVNATTSDMPNTEGCSTAHAWLVVEPWRSGRMNPDRACYASTWQEAFNAAQRLQWRNGSAWMVTEEVGSDPLVVDCAAVKRDAELGLNPYEGQVELRLIAQTVARAAVLLGRHNMTMVDYATANPDRPISELFNLLAD